MRRAQSTSAAPQPVEWNAFTGVRRGTETILVAGGDAGWRQATCRNLAQLGYRTFPAGDTRAALQLLDDARIDLLLTEAEGAGQCDGVALACVARQRYPALKILLTAGAPGLRESGDGTAQLSPSSRREDLARALHTALAA